MRMQWNTSGPDIRSSVLPWWSHEPGIRRQMQSQSISPCLSPPQLLEQLEPTLECRLLAPVVQNLLWVLDGNTLRSTVWSVPYICTGIYFFFIVFYFSQGWAFQTEKWGSSKHGASTIFSLKTACGYSIRSSPWHSHHPGPELCSRKAFKIFVWPVPVSYLMFLAQTSKAMVFKQHQPTDCQLVERLLSCKLTLLPLTLTPESVNQDSNGIM